MAQEWDLNVLAAMERAKNLQNVTSSVDNTITNVADTYHLTKGGQKNPEQQLISDQHALMERKRIQALEAQKQRALASLKTEREQVNPAFHTALSNVAGESARQARSFAEYLAQRGQTQSGLAAQAEMQRTADLTSQHGLLEQQRTQAITDLARRESDVHGAYDEGALQAALDRQLGEMTALQQLQERDRAESIGTVGQYYQDYAAKINEIEAMEARGDYSLSYLKPYLQMAKQEKVSGMQQAEAAAQQQEFENWLKQEQLNISRINATRPRGGTSSNLPSYSQALSMWNSGIDNAMVRSVLGIENSQQVDPEQAYNDAYAILQQYGKRSGQWTGKGTNEAIDYLQSLVDTGQISEANADLIASKLFR